MVKKNAAAGGKAARGDWRFERRSPPGSAPGTLTFDPSAPKTSIRAMGYSKNELWESTSASLADLRANKDRFPVLWVDVDGLGDLDTITELGGLFGLHRLALEDVINVHQRPKVDHYEHYLYIVLSMVEAGRDVGTSEQLSVFLGKNVVITFQEKRGDPFDPIRERIRTGGGRTRQMGSDFLAYNLIDAVIDHFFPAAESLASEIEHLEAEILSDIGADLLRAIHRVRRAAINLNRSVWAHSELVNTLIRNMQNVFHSETIIYLRDCHDHTLQLLEYTGSYRDASVHLIDLFLSFSSHRSNEIMRFLTLVAAIFIPLTFIAGLYGMNFNAAASPYNMPELNWRFGYPGVLAAMLALTVGMLWFFQRKGWLGRSLKTAMKESSL